MPTAIVRIVTPQGVVIAADGLESLGFFRPKNEHLQKIYPIQGLPLAYAIFGSTSSCNYLPSTGVEVVIDLLGEAKKSAELMGSQTFDDLSLHAWHFSQPILKALREKIGDNNQNPYPSMRYDPREPGQTILHVFFFGYYHGLASTVDLRIFHRKDVLQEPSITVVDVDTGPPPWVRGSEDIAKVLFQSQDDKFAPYRIPFPSNPNDLTIQHAADIAKGYITACSSEAGREVDPDAPLCIGGHIHIAQITPKGFQWIIPPKE